METGVQELVLKARAEGIVTAFDRAAANDPRCGFGLAGVCCKNCLEGPCRITPGGKGAQRGVCGANADTIVARNLLGMMTLGAAPHVEHAREVALTLLETAEGKAPYEIKEPEKLIDLACRLGIAVDGKDIRTVAKDVALVALAEFGRQTGVAQWVAMYTAPETLAKWQGLGIVPVNPHLEIAKSVNRQSMGVDADPVNLLLGSITMGLVDGYGGLHVSTDLQDVLFGVPRPIETTYRMGVLREDQVNIAVHGHIPMLSDKVVQWADMLQAEALAAGATGINVVGICCTGNEMMIRKGIPSAGSYANQELPIISGVLEALVVDCQCIMPSLPEIAACYHTELITTMSYAKIAGATHVEFSPEAADEGAMTIVRKAIAAFKRRDPAKVQVPKETQKATVGFSTEALVEALANLNEADPLQPLVEAVVTGKILGAAAIVGCTNPRLKQDWANTELAKHLLKNNVLVVTTGCSAHSLGKAGLLSTEGLQHCGASLRSVLTAVGQAAGLEALPAALHMGSCVNNSRVATLLSALATYLKVPISALPAIGSCPETHSPKAFAICGYFLAHGVDVHVGVSPPIRGSKLVQDVLLGSKEEHELTLDGLLGGKMIVEPDPEKAAQLLLERIKAKRRALGLPCPEDARVEGDD